MPDSSTLSRRKKTVPVKIPYQRLKGAPHLLIDGTGVRVQGEGEWHARKQGGPKRRAPRKIHLGIPEEVPELCAVEITASHVGDARVLADLLGPILVEQVISSVMADGAYDTRKCHDVIADSGDHAVIPTRKNAKPWKTVTAGAMALNEVLRAAKYLGQSFWRRWSGYHRRSCVETKTYCVNITSSERNFWASGSKLQLRIDVLKRHTALGTLVTEAAG